MRAFYRSLHCYVSAHCGEGFGLPIAEALLYGTPVVATNWSAPAEYAEGLFRGVGYVLEPPHGMDWQPFYTPDQEWAVPDQASLVGWMQKAHAGEVGPFPCAGVQARLHTLPLRAAQAAADALRDLRP